MSNFKDVKIFMETFGQMVKTKPSFPDDKTMQLRLALIQEELDELKVAMETKNLKEAAEANSGFNMSGMYSSAYDNVAPVIASNVNQGDTIVGASNHMHLEKAVNHSILTFSEAAAIHNGMQSNN